MAATQLAPDRVNSPLASNNPFRNRLPNGQTSPRPISTNPFLDDPVPEPVQDSAPSVMPATDAPSKSGAVETTTTLLGDLDINQKPGSPQRPRGPPNGAPRRDRMPPPPHMRRPPGHTRTPSEEEKRRRAEAKMRAAKAELDIFADPSEKKSRSHRRRNSESSVRDKPSLDPEEEKKRRERKHRESKKGVRAQKRLDVIDKLDGTSIFGTGLFHHDGPFDACNPHRNRKGSRKAPMQAFPADSMNMRLGGSGPVNNKIDIDQYHGRVQEGYNDYNEAAIADGDAEYVRRPLPGRTTSFNPTSREIVHGSESAGLGTSTFLDGAPASRRAIEEGEKEAQEQQQQQQLSRKKSLAQRFRANSNKIPSRRIQSPEGTPTTPLDSARSEGNNNPFFQNYDQEYEKKGAAIAFADAEQKPARARAPSSPRKDLPNPLERSRTADSAGMSDERKSSTEAKPSGGFLNRMKSLKGPRKPRPERRETSS